MKWQHRRIVLEVILDVQLPADEELKDNIPAYQAPSLIESAVQRWKRHAEKMVTPCAQGIGVVGMQVKRKNNG